MVRVYTLSLGQLSKKKNMGKIAIIFLSISFCMCFWCSKEPSHRDGSFDHLQHMVGLRNKKNNFLLSTLNWGPALCIQAVKALC